MCRSLLTIGMALIAAVMSGAVRGEEEGGSTDATAVWVTSIAQIGSSDQFAAASADGLLLREATVYSFPATNPQSLEPLYKHPAAVWCVVSTSDGSKLASVDYRGNLAVYDPASGEAKMHDKAFERWCQSLLVAPDDQSVIAGNEAGKIMVWDLQAGKVSKSVELDGHAVTGLAFAPDGSQLAAADGGGHIHLLKWPELESLGKIEVSEQTTWSIAYVDGGKHLLVGSSDRNIYRVEAKPDAKAESVAKGTDWITQLAVSPSGQVAAGEVGGRLHFPTTGGADSMDASSGVWTLCWNGDSQLFAGTRKDGIVTAGRSWKWTEPVAEKPAEEKPAEEKPAEEKPAEEKPAEEKPAEEKPAEEKPAEEKPAEEKPAEEAAEKKSE
jgi:WD40 repeat protein